MGEGQVKKIYGGETGGKYRHGHRRKIWKERENMRRGEQEQQEIKTDGRF